MKKTSYKGDDIRRVMIGMIVDPVVIGRIASRWPPEGLFASRTLDLIGGWAVRHFKKHGVPIGKELRTVFGEWAEGKKDEKVGEYVERLLLRLSEQREGEAKEQNSEYVLDLAGRVFNRGRLRRLREAIDGELDRNDVDAAQSRVDQFRRVELGTDQIFRPGQDIDVWREALSDDGQKPLITLPGDAGEFFGKEFARECFVAFTGGTTTGKSWWLLEFAYRATRQRNRTAVFEVGDMSLNQFARRMGQRALRRPKMSDRLMIPNGWDAAGELEKRRKRFEGITPKECMKAWEKVSYGKDLCRVQVHPNSSITAAGIESILVEWAMNGWVADVVIIDYADILAAPPGTEGRDCINENWKRMRRISQELHCLLITASQADAGSYTSELIKRGNFSDDRRKNDHVTAMIGINTTDEDKEDGMTRLNYMKRREEDFSQRRQVQVASCLAIGMPLVKSRFLVADDE